MSSAMRRGGIPGPESRTGLTRPSMTEAEFERRIGTQAAQAEITSSIESRRLRPRSNPLRVPRRPFPPGRGSHESSRPNPDGFNGCSPSRRIWTRNSGSTPSTWGRTAPRSSTTCCDPSLPPWYFTTLATAVAVEAIEAAPERGIETDGDTPPDRKPVNSRITIPNLAAES